MKKFNNFIRKTLIIALMVLLISGQKVAVLARAGGGSSGGSHGGSFHGGSFHGSSLGGRGSGFIGPIVIGINAGFMGLIFVVGVIIPNKIMRKKKNESISAINDLSIDDNNWNYDEIKKDVEEAFYNIQKAWMERNQELAREYMSKKLYDKHKAETESMIIKKEKNILDNVQLLEFYPVAVEDYEGTDKDSFWLYIKAKAIDYTINEEDNKVIEGYQSVSVEFEEYWKFIREEKSWVADEIKQTKDVVDLSFFKIHIDNKQDYSIE
ncbi:hypothetical protein BJV85_003252 [Clostridium acetobutylicum]|uniref:Predicted membrane protein n=1 Tax=Clostridium acetobutylicum (strain ATCC 824 / DSM 792 / JCM 1419 / IAM 19013 / LMG 5710 / NBRC 13948 / NRRL B-527 / VKM B-1787 / 2291 / W) TaxID=272562 RepID=Q97L09_CLOAB|nr:MULTISPECIES: Tim44-like domain-containing protein [Clostridium]AAK78733.1 Predicted membrane protein [Clostridium acetobutylicum ATCC 824]ADZ19807.1 membrane protein [Clostridium acetobutylicum EA 2018]AEI31421.1 hypothetical protein SMB_G0773 [Clostridium acetobutylicum DSM 1731]AWV80451.1 Tim44 domain-containing protein [Clostridium acetobutylicum]MBC2392642.1 Tim44 domain-containing protein [Clostridium acetobutylicum]